MTAEHSPKLTSNPEENEEEDFISWLAAREAKRHAPIKQLRQKILSEVSEIFDLYGPPSSNLVPRQTGEKSARWWSCMFIPLDKMSFRPLSRKFLDALKIEHREYYYLRVLHKMRQEDRFDEYELRIFIPSWKKPLPPARTYEDIPIRILGSPNSSTTRIHFGGDHRYPHVLSHLHLQSSEEDSLVLVLDLLHSLKNSVEEGVEIAKFESLGFSEDNYWLPG